MRKTDFEKIASFLAKEHRVKMIAGHDWKANIKTREVYYNAPDIYSLSEDHILGLILHEIAHIHYTTEVQYPKKDKELLHETINHLEDLTIEHLISQDYANAAEVLESTNEELLDVLVNMLPTLKVSEHEKALLYAAIRFQGRGWEKNTAQYEITGQKIADLMHKRRKEIYGREKTKDLLPLAQAIVDILNKDLGQLPQTDQQRMAQSQTAQAQGGGSGGQPVDREGKSIKGQAVRGLKNGGGSWGDSMERVNDNVHFVDEVGEQALMVGKRIRSILKRNKAMQFAGRFKTGKLMTKRLRRVRVNKDRRPFARRLVKSNQSYAFAVAADVSGSMGHGPDSALSYSMTGLWTVAEALRFAGVERSLLVFATRPQVVAPMNTRQIQWTTAIEHDRMQNAGGGTDIGAVITASVNELKKSKAERKIMIVLTDGDADNFSTERGIKYAKQEGVECISISLLDSRQHTSTLDELFADKRNINLYGSNDMKQIGEAFIQIVKASITADKQYD